MSQLVLPTMAWIDVSDEHKAFASFRQRIIALLQVRYRAGAAPDAPRDLARALDSAAATAADKQLVLAIDDGDEIDNGVKTFLEELIASAITVRVIVTASTLGFKR